MSNLTSFRNNQYQIIEKIYERQELRWVTALYLVEDAREGDRKLVKTLLTGDDTLIEHFKQEYFLLGLMGGCGGPRTAFDEFWEEHDNESNSLIYCYSQEYVEGENLEEWVARHGKISEKTAIAWLKELLTILSTLHKAGFFHRDVNPKNIICSNDGKLYLIDYGSARRMDSQYFAKASCEFDASINPNALITKVGTPAYAAPEQLHGGGTPRSDFYALSRTLIFALTGSHVIELPLNDKTGALEWKKKAHVSQEFAAILDWMQAPPLQRPQDGEEVLRRLKTLNSRKRWNRFINSWWGWISVTALASGIYVLGYSSLIEFRASKLHEQALQAQLNNDLELAENKYKQVLRLKKSEDVEFNLALLQQQRGNFTEALERYKSLQEQGANVSNFLIGSVYDSQQDYDMAATYYRKEIEGGELDLEAYGSLSRIYNLRGNYKESQKLAELGLKKIKEKNFESDPSTDSTRAGLLKNLGWSLFEQGDLTSARKVLYNSVKIRERADTICLISMVNLAEGKRSIQQEINCLTFHDQRFFQEYPEVRGWFKSILAAKRNVE